ncbi:IucA/IucC family protein [Hamadaea tsunoensis]|uniref:IucA/IucC family protein n=1 Tax=Hamadaea tsunoensis TaxID=53368 RepID=UPI0004261D99|nr:IucA/IucC family protein [Hamadaea tsunoensis]
MVIVHLADAPDATATRAVLTTHRPELVDAFDEALPGARAAIMNRLWTALRREPVPGVRDHRRIGNDVLTELTDGRRAIGPATEPFADRRELRVHVQSTPDGPSTAYADPAELLDALRLPGEYAARLRTEVANSVANLALARAAAPAPRPLSALQGDPQALAYLEQSVVDGHPLHPGCRARVGMSTLDVLAYAPEYAPTVDLPIWEVPRGRWLTTGAGLPPRLPLHPWQAEHLAEQLRAAGVRPTKDFVTTRPLMSLRTMASVGDPSRHYKTALAVQMTSAVRQVSPAAVHNGPRVTELLALAAGGLALRALPEVAAGAVLVDNTPHPMLAVALRRAPLPGPGEVWAPVAALTEPGLLAEILSAGYGGHPVAFWRDLVDVLVPPVLALLGRGIGLEAHGQNLLVRLAYGRPAEAGYRDVGGVRLHPGRLRAAGLGLPVIQGDLLTDDEDELRAKPFASLFAVVLARLAYLLETLHGADPAALWRLVAEHLEHVAESDKRALLGRPLPLKATTAMRLAERSVDDIWTAVPNPLAGA